MADKDTVIGPETRISGEIRGDEDLLVRGRVEGKIQLSQTLTVDDGGIVQADVEVRTLVVSGVVVGTIHASESVHLTDKARVVGDINTPRFIMDAGAAYRGRLDMGEAASVPRRTAGAASRPAPPRMATPARAASTPTSAIRAPAPPSAPPRVSSAPPRPSAPPPLPRPDAAAAASAGPAWAKKKLRRR
jgi:cytoskeletal protein CcmA (bactofilin family)